MGGTVDVQSAGAGRGSTFTVRLPLFDEAGVVTDAGDAEGGERRLRRVLVVDDNERC